MADQFDFSPQRLAVIEENNKRRAVLRNEFLKQASDPFRHAQGAGGTVFDPAIQRYNSMKASTVEHFRPTFANARFAILFAVLPIAGLTYAIYSSKAAYEEKLRGGEVAYKDRGFKFV